MGHNYAILHSNKVIAIANKLVVYIEKKVHFRGTFTQFRDFVNVYVNRRLILDEINNLLIRKTYVNEKSIFMRIC